MSSIAINKLQRYAIVCQTPPSEGGRILLKSFDSLSTLLSKTIIVNDQCPGVGQNPDVVIDDSGKVTVVWEQFVDSRIQIGLARFEAGGKQIGTTLMLKDDNSLADQIPRIAVGRDGRFVVVWCALGAGIKGQRFSREGNMVGKLFSLSEKKTQNAQFPSVKIDNQNRIGVVWQQGSLDDFRILLRVLSWNLKPSRIVQVDNAHGTAYFSNPDILFLKNGRILVAWKDYRTGEANVFQQMFSPSVTPTGKNIQVNDDTGKQWQRLPRLLSAEGAQYALVWEDYRNDVNNQMADLYFQRYTQTGSRTGENRKVEVTQEPTSQRFPAGVMKLNGELILAWSDTRWNVSSVFVKQVPVHGQQMESETQVFP